MRRTRTPRLLPTIGLGVLGALVGLQALSALAAIAALAAEPGWWAVRAVAIDGSILLVLSAGLRAATRAWVRRQPPDPPRVTS